MLNSLVLMAAAIASSDQSASSADWKFLARTPNGVFFGDARSIIVEDRRNIRESEFTYRTLYVVRTMIPWAVPEPKFEGYLLQVVTDCASKKHDITDLSETWSNHERVPAVQLPSEGTSRIGRTYKISASLNEQTKALATICTFSPSRSPKVHKPNVVGTAMLRRNLTSVRQIQRWELNLYSDEDELPGHQPRHSPVRPAFIDILIESMARAKK